MRIFTPCILLLPALVAGGLLQRNAQPEHVAAPLAARDALVPAPEVPVAVLENRVNVLERRGRPDHFAPHGGNQHGGGYPGNAHSDGHGGNPHDDGHNTNPEPEPSPSPSVEAASSTEAAPSPAWTPNTDAAPSPVWTASVETTTDAAPVSSAEATWNGGENPGPYSENVVPPPAPASTTDYSVVAPAPTPASNPDTVPHPTTTYKAPHGAPVPSEDTPAYTTASTGEKGVTSPITTSTPSLAPGVISEYVFTQWVETKIDSTSRTWVPKTITLHFHSMSPAPPPGQGAIGLGTLTGSAGQTQTIAMGAAPSKSPSWVKGAVAAVGAGIVGIMI